MASVVSRELVRAPECPVASVPGALERLLSSMHPLVCLQVRALGVHFIALWVVAVEKTLCLACRLACRWKSSRGRRLELDSTATEVRRGRKNH